MTTTTSGIFSSPLSSASSDVVDDLSHIDIGQSVLQSVVTSFGIPAGGPQPGPSTGIPLQPVVLNSENVDLSLDVDSDLEDALSVGFASDEDCEPDENAILEKEKEIDEIIREKSEAWTEDEIEDMMHYLKEEGMSEWLNEYVIIRKIPIKRLLYAFPILLSRKRLEMNELALLPVLKAAMLRELRRREKLPQYNTVDDALFLLRRAQRIIVLTGAGISVSCGIPDFRSRNGLYAMLQSNGLYDMDDPQQMFDINYFKEHPNDGWNSSFAYQIYPSNFKPSPCHRFIKALEDRGKLLRNYTQNIDTLETLTGIERVLQCHGSFASASCVNCHAKVVGTEIKDDIMAKRVPHCKLCDVADSQSEKIKKVKKKKKKKRNDGWESDLDEEFKPVYPSGIMKPDITFFGEKLSDEFEDRLTEDRTITDLLLVIGTSLKVAPVAEILTHVPHSIPQIVINKTPIRHINPDVLLLGDADGVVKYLSGKLGWDIMPPASENEPPRNTRKRSSDMLSDSGKPKRVGDTHIWLFDGAEGGSFVETLQSHFKEKEKSAAPTPALSRATSKSASNSRAPSVTGPREPSTGSQSKSTDSESQRSLKRVKSR